MKVVVFTGAGGNEVVQLVERPDPSPQGGEVRVRVRFAALNPADLLQRRGFYPAPDGSPADVPGLEVAGVVDACGSTSTRWRPGDRVFGIIGGGGLGDRVVVHERCLAAVPSSLSNEEASAVPEAFFTAHDAICTQARLRMGENILVHGAGGSVGGAALQIAREAGANVIASVRSEVGRVQAERFNAVAVDDDVFVGGVLKATEGRGADVILELVGGRHMTQNIEVVADAGRIIVVGVPAGSQATVDLRQLMRKRCTIQGTVLRSRPLELKAQVVRAFEHEALPALSAGRLTAVIDRIMPVAEIREAFDYLERPGRAGKVLVDFK